MLMITKKEKEKIKLKHSFFFDDINFRITDIIDNQGNFYYVFIK